MPHSRDERNRSAEAGSPKAEEIAGESRDSRVLHSGSYDDTIVSMNDTNLSPAQEARWLILIPQLPPKPDYLRVKLRRRLQKIGAAALRNAVYVLPNRDDAIEDFMWLRAELKEDGADAIICSADVIAGATDEEIMKLFGEDRDTVEANTELHGRTWVTRAGVFIDRIASAWLIRRFIDRAAIFKFVSPKGYRRQESELRFDMYEGEYTHEGDRCTFEVLLERFSLDDAALHAIGEIVHDIDLKDAKFNRAETAGVQTVITGVASAHADDSDRIAQGSAIFDALYSQLSK